MTKMSDPKERLFREIEAEIASYARHQDFDQLLGQCEYWCHLYGGFAILTFTTDKQFIHAIAGAPPIGQPPFNPLHPTADYQRIELCEWEKKNLNLSSHCYKKNTCKEV
jgi:hypothetical protein